MTRVNIEKAVRKALERPLNAVQAQMLDTIPVSMRAGHAAYGPGKFPIWWPNMPFWQDAGQSRPPAYVRFSYHPLVPRVRTTGENPRIALRGHIIVGCFTPEGVSEDFVDNLANAAMSAYPYAAAFDAEGFEVRVNLVDPKAAFGALGRWYKPVHINWDVWRTT